jgi:hypothetical protein
LLGAAHSTAAEGDVALTELRYVLAAQLFGEAAAYVPEGQPDERLKYMDRNRGKTPGSSAQAVCPRRRTMSGK